MLEINFQIRNIELLPKTKDYIIERINKFDKLLVGYENLTVSIVKISNSKVKNNFYEMDITLKMPHAFIKVEEKGTNINTLIDNLLEPLSKKINRYKSQEERWVKHKEWKSAQVDALGLDSGDEGLISENTYEPKIYLKYYEDDSPMHPAEAVEKMELLGHNQYMFKNIENNKYGLLVKINNIGYELIQPK